MSDAIGGSFAEKISVLRMKYSCFFAHFPARAERGNNISPPNNGGMSPPFRGGKRVENKQKSVVLAIIRTRGWIVVCLTGGSLVVFFNNPALCGVDSQVSQEFPAIFDPGFLRKDSSYFPPQGASPRFFTFQKKPSYRIVSTSVGKIRSLARDMTSAAAQRKYGSWNVVNFTFKSLKDQSIVQRFPSK